MNANNFTLDANVKRVGAGRFPAWREQREAAANFESAFKDLWFQGFCGGWRDVVIASFAGLSAAQLFDHMVKFWRGRR